MAPKTRAENTSIGDDLGAAEDEKVDQELNTTDSDDLELNELDLLEDDDQLDSLEIDSLEEDSAEETDSSSTPKERLLRNMRLEAQIEAIVLASQKPVRPADILEAIQDPNLGIDDVQETLDQLVQFYEDRGGGFTLVYLKRQGYQFQTVQDAAVVMERMFASRPRPISRAALETLSIVAYRQPVTRAEIEFIRGVDAGNILKTLMERNLVRCVGRKEIPGRPMLFGTADDFLTTFNLASVKDLPPLESFQPSREVMKDALEKLEVGEQDIDVEDYIGDKSDQDDDPTDESRQTSEPDVTEPDAPEPDVARREERGPSEDDAAFEATVELQESQRRSLHGASKNNEEQTAQKDSGDQPLSQDNPRDQPTTARRQ